MTSITLNVDDDPKERTEQHPEINWSGVMRQAIEAKIDALNVMDELTSESDVRDIAAETNERVDEESA
jgi:hypothetical protein